MIRPNWYMSDQARFFAITINEKDYLVCSLNSVNREIKFVEDVETGKRAVPSPVEKQLSSEKLIENLIARL